MGTLRWYKRDPRAALAGMMELTLEERGAYNTVLDLIYTHDGAIEDNNALISSWLRVDARVWKRLRQRLLDTKKIYIHAGCIHNETADREVDRALSKIASAAQAGLASAVKRGYGVRDINGMQATTVERALERSTSTTTNLSSYRTAQYGMFKGLTK